jgi:hypothetical protein
MNWPSECWGWELDWAAWLGWDANGLSELLVELRCVVSWSERGKTQLGEARWRERTTNQVIVKSRHLSNPLLTLPIMMCRSLKDSRFIKAKPNNIRLEFNWRDGLCFANFSPHFGIISCLALSISRNLVLDQLI